MTESITAEELDAKFDAGEDISEYADWEHVVRTNGVEEFDEAMREFEKKNVSIALPEWLVDVLDAEAERRATSRRAVINDWLVDRADAEAEKRSCTA